MKSRNTAALFITIGLFVATAVAASTLDNSKLVNAVKNRDIATVRTLLKQHADPNAPDVDGTTPLIWAAHNGDAETGKLLIAAGANVKAVQRMLGHAKASMTLDVYADLFDEDLDGVAGKLDAAIRSAADQLRTSSVP